MNCKGRKFQALASAEMSSSNSQNSKNNDISSSESENGDTEHTPLKLPQQIVKYVQLKASCQKGAMQFKTSAKKTSVEKRKERKWTEYEIFIFANVLVNDGFANMLEMLALKRSSNAKVFLHIKNLFDKALAEKLQKKYTSGSLEKLQIALKQGVAWQHPGNQNSVLNEVFAECCTNLDLCSEAANNSFVRNQDENELQDSEVGKDKNEEGNDVTKKAKLVVKNLNQKIPTSRSQTQTITELAKSIDRSIKAQNKRAKMFADEERERHSAYALYRNIMCIISKHTAQEVSVFM